MEARWKLSRRHNGIILGPCRSRSTAIQERALPTLSNPRNTWKSRQKQRKHPHQIPRNARRLHNICCLDPAGTRSNESSLPHTSYTGFSWHCPEHNSWLASSTSMPPHSNPTSYFANAHRPSRFRSSRNRRKRLSAASQLGSSRTFNSSITSSRLTIASGSSIIQPWHYSLIRQRIHSQN